MNGFIVWIFVSSILALANGDCKNEWKGFRDSCYLFVNDLLDWHDAQEDCQDRGGWLVDIVDAEENAFVHSNLHDYWNWHHIGLTDQDDEGTFKWVTGSNLEYNNFWPGEPNNSGGKEDCAEMRYSGLWNDVSCSKEQYFICEKDNEDVPSTTTQVPC